MQNSNKCNLFTYIDQTLDQRFGFAVVLKKMEAQPTQQSYIQVAIGETFCWEMLKM